MFKSDFGERFKVNSFFFYPSVALPSFISTCKNTSARHFLTVLALSSPAAELLWTHLACSQLRKSAVTENQTNQTKKKQQKEGMGKQTSETMMISGFFLPQPLVQCQPILRKQFSNTT